MKLLLVTLSLIALGVGSPAPKHFLIETDGDILKDDSNVLGQAADQDNADYSVSFPFVQPTPRSHFDFFMKNRGLGTIQYQFLFRAPSCKRI